MGCCESEEAHRETVKIMEQSECVFAGTYTDTMPNKNFLFNENIIYDTQNDKQRIARCGYSSIKGLTQGKVISIFTNSAIVIVLLNVVFS